MEHPLHQVYQIERNWIIGVVPNSLRVVKDSCSPYFRFKVQTNAVDAGIRTRNGNWLSFKTGNRFLNEHCLRLLEVVKCPVSTRPSN